MIEWIVTSSVLIAVLTALRYVLRGRIALRLQYALWALALFRLLIPVSLGHSVFSVMNVIPERAPETVLSATAPEGAYTAPEGVTPAPIPAAPAGEAEAPVFIGVTGEQPVKVFDWGELAQKVWMIGAFALGLWFLIANLRFARRLRKSRQPVKAEGCRLPVYISPGLDTPCLFGIIRPAVYLTEEAARDKAVLRHALEHELTHFRHGDHVWGALRGVCLALHWYNPLVWLAAVLSRRDSELACDEGAIRRLGEEERAAYGRTLIGLAVRRRPALLVAATTMTGSAKSLRERVRLIAKKPKTVVWALIAVVLIAAVAAGCTLTGAKEQPEEDGPWTWAQGLDWEEVDITFWGESGSEFRLNRDDRRRVVELLNALSRGDFVENRDLVGGTPTYGLHIVTSTGDYYLNESIALGCPMEIQYGAVLWGISNEALSDYVRALLPAVTENAAVEFAFETDNYPQEVLDYARDYTQAQMDAIANTSGCRLTEAKITGLTQMDTGTVGLYDGVNMYRLEYRLLPVGGLPGGVGVEDGFLTERTAYGQPYLLLYFAENGDTVTWQRVCDTTTAVIEREYGTPEMLEKYGNAYTAAAMELYAQHRAGTLRLERLPADTLCVVIRPTEGGYFYVPLPDQDMARAAYEKAVAAADERYTWIDGDEADGLTIAYNDAWWSVARSGALVRRARVEPEDARELVDMCRGAAARAGLTDPVRPEDIRGVVSATMTGWYGGTITVTDEKALDWIESRFSSAQNLIGGAGCPFSSLLTLETEDGRTLTVAVAADSCGVYMTEGVYYKYASGNEEFYAFFAPPAIREALIEGADYLDWLLPYMNWTYYDKACGPDGVFEAVDALRAWAMPEEPLADDEKWERMMTLLWCTAGLDGYHADAYASLLRELYEYDGETFAWCCLGNLPEERGDTVIALLAYAMDTNPAETRGTLETLVT